MIGASELRVQSDATAADVKAYRQALTSFLSVFRFESDFIEDISLAVGEVLANAVEHAAVENGSTQLELSARAEGVNALAVEVYDPGTFVVRERRDGRGFGLQIVRAIAADVTIQTERGTRVRMVFSAS